MSPRHRIIDEDWYLMNIFYMNKTSKTYILMTILLRTRSKDSSQKNCNVNYNVI